jgi:hypothetical protein
MILAVAAAFAGAAGCGGGEEPTSTTSAATSSTTVPPETTQAAPTEEEQPVDDGGADEEDAEGTGGVAADSPGSDPESALEAFFVSGDPDLVCGELAADELLSSAYGDEQGCRAAQAPGATPKSIEIVSLEESGDSAKAVVIPTGGPNDGFEHEVVLVREGDSWLVDSLEADIPAGP